MTDFIKNSKFDNKKIIFSVLKSKKIIKYELKTSKSQKKVRYNYFVSTRQFETCYWRRHKQIWDGIDLSQVCPWPFVPLD